MTDWLWAQSDGTSISSPGEPAAPGGARAPQPRLGTRRNWLREPKSAVWIVLAAIVLIGGGRRLLWSWRARKAVARLSEPDVTPEELEAVADFGRAGAWELLRIFSTTESETTRTAAGLALARIWKDDHLVAEEEKAVVRRGFAVTWSARRRYPRALHAEIPIAAGYGVPFLSDDPARPGRGPRMVPPDRRRPPRRTRGILALEVRPTRGRIHDRARRFPDQRAAPIGAPVPSPDRSASRAPGNSNCLTYPSSSTSTRSSASMPS